MKGEKFQDKFNDYWRKTQDGQWLEIHLHDPRNSDFVQTKIQLETDSRTTISYLKALIDMCNEVRKRQGLESLT